VNKTYSGLVTFSLVTLLAACAGQGTLNESSPDTPQATPGAISGTAAIGAPMANAQVKIKGKGISTACEKVTTANAKGVFSVALDGCSGPFIISAESNAGKIYSIATDEDTGNIVNVTPLTQVIATRVFNETNLEAVDIASSNITKSDIDTQTTEVSRVVAEIAKSFGASSVNIRKGSFSANGAGLDKLLDVISVQPGSSSTVIGIKGTSAIVSVPKDPTTTPGAFSANEASAATTTITEFSTMKSIMLAGINACLASRSLECYKNFFHANYQDDGNTVEDEWDDIYWDGMEVKLSDLVLISMNATRDEAWVAFTAKEKEQDSGQTTTWLKTNKIKKINGSWKLFGNQIPHSFNVQPGLITYGLGASDVKRGINFRIFNWSGVPDDFSFQVKSLDLGIDLPITLSNSNDTSWEYFTASPTDFSPACISNNNDCKSFLIQPKSTSPLFPKVELSFDNGSTWNEIYIPSTPNLPSASEDVPVFSNLKFDADLCKQYDGQTFFPSDLNELRWMLPSGFSTEGASFYQNGSGYQWDLTNIVQNLKTDALSMPFGSALSAPNYMYTINNIQFRLELRDRLDRAFFLIYGCSNP
jgi:hypothetical protein